MKENKKRYYVKFHKRNKLKLHRFNRSRWFEYRYKISLTRDDSQWGKLKFRTAKLVENLFHEIVNFKMKLKIGNVNLKFIFFYLKKNTIKK